MQDPNSTLNCIRSADSFWTELQGKYPTLNVIEEYERAYQKLGRHPGARYFATWLENAKDDFLPPPPLLPAPWQPPTREAIFSYCAQKRWTRSFANHAYCTLIAYNWHFHGHKISSDGQWQAVLEVLVSGPSA